MDTKTEDFQMCHPVKEAFFILYQAIRIDNFKKVKLLFDNRTNINAPLITAGSLMGYTALHIACMEGKYDLVEILIEDLHADANVTANNGVQPVHLATLIDRSEILEMLVQANGNVDAKIKEDMVIQHRENKPVWCADFGNEMTILTYSVLFCQDICIRRLLRCNANKNVISLKNKTLMMYAVERKLKTASVLAFYHIDKKIINHRDNDGRHIIHYLLHPRNYGNFRYTSFEPIGDSYTNGLILRELIRDGADINALINDDPDTLLLNMAAYRASASILEILLPYYDSISQSKALYYATLPVQDNQIKLNPYEGQNNLSERRRKCLELILKDLVNRRTFGLAVPDREEKLLDDLIKSDALIASIVHNYKRNFINRELKNHVIRYGDKTIVYYDLISLSIDSRKLQKIVKDETLLNNFDSFQTESENYAYFKSLIQRRVEKAVKRIKLLNKLKTLSQLTTAIPLPYELILSIIEYINNEDLETFIDAFFFDGRNL